MAKGKKRSKKRTLAERADRYELYLQAVQAPDVDAEFARDVYRREFDRRATRLREDFCGTAAICCEWVKLHDDNRAWGVDLDPEPLQWGRENNLAALKKKQRRRVELIEGDVRTVETPPVDVVMAQNFSYFLFEERATLVSYFQSVHQRLDESGLLILDVYGGPEAVRESIEETEHDDFTYCWDQDGFDPISRRARCHIHFDFPDGSRMERAFTYEWRMWTLPELREALADAGFAATSVWWEGTDEETGEGDGEYTPQESAEADDAWVAYVVAVKR
jgi:hypothetical protein